MALLRAYCDASFTDPNKVPGPGWTAIAGYIGTEEVWQDVERQWAEKKELWGLEEFSFAKIRAGRSPVGLTHADQCIESFGSIIGDSTLEGVSAAINDADWEATYKSDRFPHKYHGCVSMLFHIIDEHVRLDFKGDLVAIVLDTDRAPDEALHALIKEWQHESNVIASVTFGRRRQYPLLECADLCAGRERLTQLAGGWGPGLREGFKFAVSHAKKHRGAFWSLESQRQLEEQLAKREREREGRRRRRSEGD
jgi:hypothetical protein